MWKGAVSHSSSAFARSCKNIPCRTEDYGKCSRFPALLGCGFALVSVFSLLLSLLVLCRTSDLQSRVSDLEKLRYTQLSALVSADQMETAILGRVDQLLEEVCTYLLITPFCFLQLLNEKQLISVHDTHRLQLGNALFFVLCKKKLIHLYAQFYFRCNYIRYSGIRA